MAIKGDCYVKCLSGKIHWILIKDTGKSYKITFGEIISDMDSKFVQC